MTIKESIIRYLEEQGTLQFSGKLCRAVAEIHLCKESNVERRCRELENSGTIERHLLANPSGGNKVVAYRLSTIRQVVYKPMQNLNQSMHWRPEVAKQKLISDSQPNLI